MTTQQPEALRLAVSSSAMADEGEMIHLLSWYEIRNLLRADAAELRRLHTENTALQQGYAAARLEIESLQARIKTMAEEHADELTVAHLDGRMRAAQPAGAQQPTTQTAPQQEAQEPYSIDADPQGIRALVADAITGALAFGAQGTNAPPDGHWLAPFWAAARAESEAAPQPSPASHGNGLDTARLDWLDKNIFHRDMDEWDAKHGRRGDCNMWVMFAPKGHQGSARNIIDAARKQGANHD